MEVYNGKDYMAVVACNTRPAATLDVKHLNIDEMKIKESTRYVRKAGTTLQGVPPRETVGEKSAKTVVCRTQVIPIENIEIIVEDDIDLCLGPLIHS